MSERSGSPFHDLDQMVALPRLTGLVMSPDGTRLATTVQGLNPKANGYSTSIWQVDPSGESLARRLTHSARGESSPVFAANGDLYFLSARPDPAQTADSPEVADASLWRLPAEGGEAVLVHRRPGGVSAVTFATESDQGLLTAPVLPGATDEESHAALSEVRKDASVNAILHSGYPVRHWDHDLGPERPQLFKLETPAEDTAQPNDRACLQQLTDNDRSFGGNVQLSPDGTRAVYAKVVYEAKAQRRTALAHLDLTTGQTRILVDDPGFDHEVGPISPAGRHATVVRSRQTTPDTAPSRVVYLLDLDSGDLRPITAEFDRWLEPTSWFTDGSALLALGDDHGRGPIWKIDLVTGQISPVTADDATYSEAICAPDGRTAYGVRSSYAYPAEVVRIDLESGEVTALSGPNERPQLPGRLTEVETVTEDGVTVRAWLALPHDAEDEPAPLLLWIHGGPLASWNAWSWRWIPWRMVALGYAVLLPDPALSTGYGQDFIQRGWGAWGKAPYTDLMAITDAVERRTDIDESRTAALGGSFGGYMANWIATQTDRFAAIVTHASLYALDQFGPSTDSANYWSREVSPQMQAENSPHLRVGNIVTPMLVIHGDKDYRVPIGEGLRLWYELLSSSGSPVDENGETVHRFLYFPGENHWILTPQHAKVWYATVEAFLSTHVRGTSSELPRELGL